MPRGFDIGELYLDKLQSIGQITEKSFSTHFTGLEGDSFVDFGPYQESSMWDKNFLVELPVYKGFFYSATPQGVRFGDAENGSEFALDGSEAVFTTGVSLSMVPSSMSVEFFKRLLAGVDSYELNGVFYVDCNQ